MAAGTPANARPCRAENGYGVKDARVATIEPDEHGSVRPTQMHSTGHALLQDVELMPQYQDFRLPVAVAI
jgi:hypothetical protein